MNDPDLREFFISVLLIICILVLAHFAGVGTPAPMLHPCPGAGFFETREQWEYRKRKDENMLKALKEIAEAQNMKGANDE